VLADIQSGKFTSEWMQEYRAGASRFRRPAVSPTNIRSRKWARSCADDAVDQAGALVDKSKN